MKQPERVAELLAELRALTENDFERHRIDVLERDLHEPPQVEIIDDTHQRFNGVTYHKGKGGHYAAHYSIHRDVWSYSHGEIPSGYVIHHVDESKDNNCIENLQILTSSAHSIIHNEKNKVPPKICPACGKNFIPSGRGEKASTQICCSIACRDAYRTKTFIEKVCPVCGTAFTVKRSRATQICCSPACGYIHKTKSNAPRKCIICGKEFIPPKYHDEIRTCSRSCSGKLAWQTRQAKLAETQTADK